MEKISILRVPFAVFTQENAVEYLLSQLSARNNRIVVTPNPEGVMLARRNKHFREALITADVSLCDGTGVLIASRLLGTPLPERVRGFDTFVGLLNSGKPLSIFLLGGKPGVAEKARTKIETQYTNITIAGTHHGFFTEEEEVVDKINAASPDILVLCTGMPRAEIWAVKNKNLKTGLTMCLGGTIDVLAGEVKLAPAFIRKIGMEWLYRLLRQPARFKRMLDLPRFVAAVLWERIIKK